ncbi:MAG TPA: LysM domain-containing protein [Thermoleophilaceae bacterium]|nr:LysM domain-containing protein [Thermoleophilaceae bacterium]
MPTHSSRSSARILAPAAIAVCALAVLVVIGSSLSGGGSSGGDPSVSQPASQQTAGTAERPRPRQRANYTIKAGDTLGGIAEQTGVPVETLQELNPELDPQALIAGQKIKLRE